MYRLTFTQAHTVTLSPPSSKAILNILAFEGKNKSNLRLHATTITKQMYEALQLTETFVFYRVTKMTGYWTWKNKAFPTTKKKKAAWNIWIFDIVVKKSTKTWFWKSALLLRISLWTFLPGVPVRFVTPPLSTAGFPANVLFHTSNIWTCFCCFFPLHALPLDCLLLWDIRGAWISLYSLPFLLLFDWAEGNRSGALWRTNGRLHLQLLHFHLHCTD